MSPWEGRDALDAAVLMDVGMAQFREHMKPGTSAHRVFTEGGTQPNVDSGAYHHAGGSSVTAVPRACKHCSSRGSAGPRRRDDGELRVETSIMAGVWPVRGNETIARTIQSNIEAAGMPVWNAEEQDFARALQKGAGKPQTGLHGSVTPLTGPCEPIMASNDCGDVSWVVPMGRVWFPGNIPHAAFHHWSAGAALTTSIAHKGAVAGAKALSASALDFLTSVNAVDEAWKTLQVRDRRR